MTEESVSRRAARWVERHGGLVQDAAELFGVTRQSVASAWRALWGDRPLPSMDKTLRDDQIVALAEFCYFPDEIAARVGIAYATVMRVLRRRGAPLRSRREDSRRRLDSAAAAALDDDDGTVSDVATGFGVAAQRLQRHINRSGITLPRRSARDRARRDGRAVRAAALVQSGEMTVLQACAAECCAAPAVYRMLKRSAGGAGP